MLNTVQCQNPLPVGASGSNTVKTKLLVPIGGFDQCSAGDWFCPEQPNSFAVCAVVNMPPTRSELSSVNVPPPSSSLLLLPPQPAIRPQIQARARLLDDISISGLKRSLSV